MFSRMKCFLLGILCYNYIFPVDNLLFPKFNPNEKYLKCMKYFGKKGEMIVVVCFLFALTLKYTKSICRSIKGETCCSGSYRNKDTSTCEKCPLGYHDINCSEICSYPSYGADCQGTCHCLLRLCDYRHGCPDNNDTNNPTTFHFKTDTTFKTTSVSNVTEDSNMYFEDAILGILLVLCGVCAGIIFFKRCRRRNFIAVKQQEGHLVNNKICHELVANDLKSDEAVDPTYLDPVYCYRSADSIDIEIGRLSVENISSREETLNV